jgi:hypothetical protein
LGRADVLATLLGTCGLRLGGPAAARPDLATLSPRLARAVDDCYRRLGGRIELPRLRPGRWDLVVEDVMVELDEDLHFNRYRALTLGSAVYRMLPTFPLHAYRTYAASRETECLAAGSYGGKWTNPSCERHFGPAGPLGQLEGPGAPRWRQRALYDLMKDLAPLHDGTRISRIAVWDALPGMDGYLVNDALVGRVSTDVAAASLRQLVAERTIEPAT